MFYDRFKALCKSKGISCNRAAVEIGLSNATPTVWKNRGITPNGETLARIAEYFNVSTDYLLHGISGYQPIGPDEHEPEEHFHKLIKVLNQRGNSQEVVSAKVMPVIVVETLDGRGTEGNPRRKKKQFWSLEGELLATK